MTRHLPEQARREQILSAARHCFIDNGYHPTRMDDIAKAAGLSKGGVYFHFKSKQEVFESLVNEEYQSSMEFLRSVTEREVPIAEKMQAIGMHYLEYFTKAPDAPRFFIVMGEMALRDEELSKKLLDMQTAFIEQIARLIDQGVAEGMLRPVDSKVVAGLLKALLDGVEGLNALKYPMDVNSHLATGMDLVMNGLLRPMGSEAVTLAPTPVEAAPVEATPVDTAPVETAPVVSESSVPTNIEAPVVE